MWQFLDAHNTTIAVVVMYVFSTAVSSMAPPTNTSGGWYKFWYKFLNGLAANVSAIRGKAQYEEPPAAPEGR